MKIIDGKIFQTDETWNLSPAILKLLDRRLLNENSNPLYLLKQRIIGNISAVIFRGFKGIEHRYSPSVKMNLVLSDFDMFITSVCYYLRDVFLFARISQSSRKPSDTYYINESHCLRAHTSAHQHRLVQEGLNAFLVIGDVYRRDEVNRTHYPCFHQVEGVRLYSSDQLFNTVPGEELPLIENGIRTFSKQEKHSEDTTKVLEIQLKRTLESLCDALFGSKCEKRWVNAYFPFTHPSYELEVFYKGNWLEVLGCGIMEQQLLESAGVSDRVGWAFGIGLERIAMILYDIPDIRLFWSKDSGFLSQFDGKSPEDRMTYKAISVHPQVIFDMSFFLPSQIEFGDMTANVYDTIRSIGGDLIEQVTLTDEYTNKEGINSQTYRVVYRSHDRALMKEEVNIIHKKIEQKLAETYNIILR
uniref:phenylalanine--tRNA ligase n=1 Tax=Heterorhabditis bacteriophora TaxID=37862 RepID=A0A1I7XN12_HETBA